MKNKVAQFEEDIKADVLLDKKINFGIFTSYLRQYENMVKNGFEKKVENYDLVFSIILNHILEKSPSIRVKKDKDILLVLRKHLLHVNTFPELFVFENVGISNTDYFIENTSEEKELKTNIPLLSIIKVLKLADKYFNIPQKYNNDSLRRYVNIYDLLTLNHTVIDKENLKLFQIDFDFDFKSYILKIDN